MINMITIFEKKNFGEELTLNDLDKFTDGEMICEGYGYIEHYWFNDAKENLEEDKKSTKIKFVCIKCYGNCWKAYHSLDANLERSDYLDGFAHLSASFPAILAVGQKMNIAEVKRNIPCTDEVLKYYDI